jgi:integrase
MECLRLQVQDLDFEYLQVLVRHGKGGKDRVTMLPRLVVPQLKAHLEVVKERHRRALAAGYGGVELPEAVARKYPGATLE